MNKQHLSIKAWYFFCKKQPKVWLKVDFHCLVIFACVCSTIEEMYESLGVHVKTLKLDQVYVWYIASTLFMYIKVMWVRPKKKMQQWTSTFLALYCAWSLNNIINKATV